MTSEEKIVILEKQIKELNKLIDDMVNVQVRHSNALGNILQYMETHKLQKPYRPQKLDS